MRLPFALTLGDPAGIGPEIAVRAALDQPDTLLIGQPAVARRAIDLVAPGTGLDIIDGPDGGALGGEASRGRLRLMSVGADVPVADYGTVTAAAGQVAAGAIMAAIALAREGRVAGIVTAPIHKEALSAAGVPFPGHTEMLAHHGGGDGRVAMMLANDEIRTVLVTIHMSLADAIRAGDHAAQMSAIRLAHEGCRAFGIARPRVAVAGLNPHAGEGGLFGREEIEVIAPAIAAARAEGIDVAGPIAADTVFHRAYHGAFDLVIAQYHDQGHIPIKLVAFDTAVNVTVGLPIDRVSVDHGTAFDVAGTGRADHTNMNAALAYARRLTGDSA